MGYKLVLLSGVLTHSSCQSWAAPVMLMLRILLFAFYFAIYLYKTVRLWLRSLPQTLKKKVWRSCYVCVRCNYAVLSDLKALFGTVLFSSAQPNHIHTIRSRLRIKCYLLPFFLFKKKRPAYAGDAIQPQQRQSVYQPGKPGIPGKPMEFVNYTWNFRINTFLSIHMQNLLIHT